MSFRPLHDRVVVRRVDSEEKKLLAASLSLTLQKKSLLKALSFLLAQRPRRRWQAHHARRESW